MNPKLLFTVKHHIWGRRAGSVSRRSDTLDFGARTHTHIPTYIHKFLKTDYFRGAWAVEHLTLGFRSGQDLSVRGWGSVSRSTLSVESAWVSLSLCPFPDSLSLKINVKKY